MAKENQKLKQSTKIVNTEATAFYLCKIKIYLKDVSVSSDHQHQFKNIEMEEECIWCKSISMMLVVG